MKLKAFLSLLILCLTAYLSVANSSGVGVCLGGLGNNLPSPKRSIELIKNLKAKQVKIYNADPEILKALKNTGLEVSIMVPNEIIIEMSDNQTLADQWVQKNVVPFLPETAIRYLLVGNEILSLKDEKIWLALVPAMRKVKKALKNHRILKVKVGTPLATDVLESSFPPSNGTFRTDVSERVMKPMLQFLNRTKSFLFLDVYTYFAWASDPGHVSLDYALFRSRDILYTDPNTGLKYTNLFDQILDAAIFAMKRVGFPDIRIFIAETGWPNGGDFDQIGASLFNAASYNRNVVKKLTAKPAIGTPARPGSEISGFLFALYNENMKPGPGTERHFGLLYPNGKGVYPIDLAGESDPSEYPDLPAPGNDRPFKGKIWCVASREAVRGNRTAELAAAVSYACSQGNKTCDLIQPGGICSRPDSLARRASFAFSSYWSQLRKSGANCFFNGFAVQTTKDPSYGYCKYPSVTL